MEISKYNHRLIGRFLVEAVTPLAIGNGENSLLTDSPVVRDINGLPYIPGSSLAGVLRHATPKGYDLLFGKGGEDGSGSRIIVSEARMVDREGKVIDGIAEIDSSDDFFAHYLNLPIRQHVRINSRGTADVTGKFDKEIVYRGTRFYFEIELLSNGDDSDIFNDVLSNIGCSTVRFGSGTRNGLGELGVVSSAVEKFDLTKEEDLSRYIERDSRLSAEDLKIPAVSNKPGMRRYDLKITPDNFYLLGSGFGDDDADMTPVSEDFLKWDDGKASFVENALLIPASSLKGAISHRSAYHYNKATGRFAGKPDLPPLTGDANPAVAALFGTSGDTPARGNVIFSDIIHYGQYEKKLLNHVSIDKFTGGTIDGALFFEKVVFSPDITFSTDIYVDVDAIHDPVAISAFEKSLEDLCNGLLPLGGGNNRGNGFFHGTFKPINIKTHEN